MPLFGARDGRDLVRLIDTALAADGAAGDTLASTHQCSITEDCLVQPFLHALGALTANDTNYASISFALVRAGTPVTTRTITTQTTASGGTGNWVNGSLFTLAPMPAVRGDEVRITVTKPGTGVAQPARVVGVDRLPAIGA